MTTSVPPSAPGPRPAGPPPTTLTARSPEDLLAAVPVVLGFHPEDSLVLLTFGAAHPFHARVDLPRTPAEADLVIDALLAPVRREGARAAAVVVYAGADAELLARRAGRALVAALEGAGVAVVDLLRADGARWFPLRPGSGAPPGGVPYDLSTHPFSARGVLDGRVVTGTREDLAAALDPAPAGVAALTAALVTASPADAARVGETVRRRLASGSVPDPELAEVLLGIREPAVRDAAWAPVRRRDAREHVRLWTDALRRAPAEVAGSAAAVLGYAAWVAGDGALAWCALDRCAEVDPGNSLGGLVADLLERAVPPDVLEEVLGPIL